MKTKTLFAIPALAGIILIFGGCQPTPEVVVTPGKTTVVHEHTPSSSPVVIKESAPSHSEIHTNTNTSTSPDPAPASTDSTTPATTTQTTNTTETSTTGN
jgi:hypothetical protein